MSKAQELFNKLEDINPLAFKDQRQVALALITAALQAERARLEASEKAAYDVAGTIEALKAQLAMSQARVRELEAELVAWKHSAISAEAQDMEIATLTTRLAQVEEALKEAKVGQHDGKRYRLILDLTRLELTEMSPTARVIWERFVKGGWYVDDLEALIDAELQALHPSQKEQGT